MRPSVAICRAFIFALALVSVVAVSSFTSSRVSAGFAPVSPEELKMTSEPQAPGAAAIILYRQVDRDDNIKTGNEDNYFRIKILKEEGRKYANVEIPSYMHGGDIVGIKARTIRPDGTIVEFDGKVFDKPILKGRGRKFRAKTFTLPDVQVGSIIEYSYVQLMPEYSLYNSHWILSQELFTKNAKFSLKPCFGAYGQSYFVRWVWNKLPAGAMPKEGPDGIIRMEASNIPAFKSEDHMPPEDELRARVDFVYSDERFEPDFAKFWRKTGKRLHDRLEDFIGKPKAMEQAVAEIVSPSDPPETKLRKIYARVQQLRNTSYELRKTSQEERREDRKEIKNAEDLWKQGYGNGQQLTWLFLALARAAGIEAHGVWASDRSNYFFNPQTMEDSKLNANVVLVKVDGKDLYFDPGAAFTPYGLLPWPETGVKGLRMDKEGGSWIITSVPPSSSSLIERKARMKLSEEGDLEGEVTVTFTGLEAMQLRLDERNSDDTERKKVLEDSLKESIPSAAEVELTNKPAWSSSDPALVAEFHVKVPGWAAAAGRRSLLQAGLFGAPEKQVFSHTQREHPVYFEYPFERADDVTIEPPTGWQVTDLPRPQAADVRVVAYAMQADRGKDGTLHLARKLKVDILLLEQKYYDALRDFFQVVRTGDEGQIVLQPGTAVTSN